MSSTIFKKHLNLNHFMRVLLCYASGAHILWFAANMSQSHSTKGFKRFRRDSLFAKSMFP